MPFRLSLYFVIASISLAISFASWGDEQAEQPSLYWLRDQQHFSVDVGTVDYTYEEPGLMRIRGEMTQVHVSYRRNMHLQHERFWWGTDLNYIFGKLIYSGSLQNFETGALTPVTYPTKDSIVTARGLFGFPLLERDSQLVNVYVGLATWYLQDRAQGDATYDRKVIYFYLPLGIEYSLSPGAFTWTSFFEFNPQLLGIVQSSLSQANSNFPDVTNYQFMGFGLKLSTKGEWNAGSFSLFGEVFYQLWSMQESTATDITINGQPKSLAEPTNDTEMLGFNLGGRF